MRAAERLNETVKKPAILTRADIQYGLERLRANRQVFIHFCGDDDKCVQFATVTQLQNAIDQLDYPQQTPVYVVASTKREALNAWPIIWQGAVGKKYILVAYVDPVRYGFKSQAKIPLSVGPETPMPIDKRTIGFSIIRDFSRAGIRFEPRVEGEDGTSEGKARKPLETVSARKLTFR